MAAGACAPCCKATRCNRCSVALGGAAVLNARHRVELVCLCSVYAGGSLRRQTAELADSGELSLAYVWRSAAQRCVAWSVVQWLSAARWSAAASNVRKAPGLGSVTPGPAIGPRRACNRRARSRSTMSTRHRHLRSFRTAHSSKAAEVPHRTVLVGDSGIARCGVRWSLYLGCRVVCAASPVGASSSVPVGAYL
jgi:hypothetical protein